MNAANQHRSRREVPREVPITDRQRVEQAYVALGGSTIADQLRGILSSLERSELASGDRSRLAAIRYDCRQIERAARALREWCEAGDGRRGHHRPGAPTGGPMARLEAGDG
jgi:hypothetical protein